MIKLKITDGKVGANIGFERLRRITGYLSPIHKWNEAKKAELNDRVKHDCGQRKQAK